MVTMTTPDRDVVLAAEPAASHAELPASTASVWQALSGVPDPEIPVVSIVELGIVRAVERQGAGKVIVRITPTYSGCPATDVILRGIREALEAAGVDDSRVDVEVSPPWTTDWIAPEAKEKLRTYGIAPPGSGASRVDVRGISPLRRATSVPCPRCGSVVTTLLAQFGSTACKALYRCEDCREPFDYFKPF
jgi:ring-1,2-phenylacetyl-CoA epoxidase subunit PaaD